MSNRKLSLGRWGEGQAARFLQGNGYEILERNARTPYGELDLVARQGTTLVFVEVKTRTTSTFGDPEQAVTVRKQNHLKAAAQAYLQAHPELDGDWRIDVIAIQRGEGKRGVSITHFDHAVW